MLEHLDTLPKTARNLLIVLAPEVVLELIDRLGGMTVSVPMHEASINHGHVLVSAIGLTEARKLAGFAGGGLLRLPRAVRYRCAIRDEKLVQAHADGATLQELVARFGLTDRRIHQILVERGQRRPRRSKNRKEVSGSARR